MSSSKTVDERVVEMQFDNKDFESNVDKSLGTIDKLKDSLDFSDSSKGLEDVNEAVKNVDMSSLSEAVEETGSKFSAMEVVAITALQNITNSVINTGKQMISSLSVDQISEGWTKYEEKTSAVQTIMNATGDSIETVNAQMEKLNWFTDETSYSFTDMTENIGKFTSNGVDLDTAVTAMEGISNWAALSGGSINEASRAMYNLAQSISMGYVQALDWRSIEGANMATTEFRQTAIDTAISLGTLKETEEGIVTASGDSEVSVTNFNSALKDQWFTSDVLLETLQKYGEYSDAVYEVCAEEGLTAAEAMEVVSDETMELGKKAFVAAQEAKTFTEAINSVKDAVSTNWMNIFESMFGDYEEARVLWTELANTLIDVFASGSLKDLMKGTMNSGWQKLTAEIEDAGVEVEDFQDAVIETAKKHDIAIDDMIDEYGSFEKTLTTGWLTSDLVSEALNSLTGIMGSASSAASDAAGATSDLTDKLEEFQDIVNQVIRGNYGNGQERVEKLTAAGYDYATVQGLVNKVLLGTDVEISDLSDAELENLGYTEKEIDAIRDLAEQAEESGSSLNELIESLDKPSGRELFIDSLRNALNGLLKVLSTVKDAWQDIFPAMTTNRLYGIIESIHNFSEHLVMSDETADKLRRTLKGLFAILDIIKTVISDAVNMVLGVLRGILGKLNLDILGVTANVGDAIVSFRDWFKAHDVLATAIKVVSDLLKVGIELVKEWIDKLASLPGVQKFIARLQETFGDLFSNLKTYFSGGMERIGEFIDRVRDMDSITLENVKAAFKDFKDNVLGYFIDFGKIGNYFSGGIAAIKDFVARVRELDSFSFENVKKVIADFVQNVIGYFLDFDGIISKVRSGFEKLVEALGERFDGLSNILSNLGGGITNIIDNLGEKLSNIGFGDIIAAAFGVGLIAVIKKVTSFLGKFGELAEAVAKVAFSASGVLNGVKKVLKSFSTELKAKALEDVAISIGILVASIVVLCQLDTGKMFASIGALVILAGVLVGMCAAMGALTKVFGTGFSTGKMGAALLEMAAAILILDIVIHSLSGMSVGEIAKGLVVIALVEAMFLAFVILSKFAGGNAGMAGSMLLKMSVAIGILAIVIRMISGMSAGEIAKGLVVIGIVEGLFIAFIAVSMFAGFNAKEAGTMLLEMSAAMLILAITIRVIANTDNAAITKGLAVIVWVSDLFMSFIELSLFAGRNAAKAGAMLLEMSAAMLIIAITIRIIAATKKGSIAKGVAVIDDVGVLFAAFIVLSKFAGDNAAKAGAMLLEMSAAMLILSVTMIIIGRMKPEAVEQALNAIDNISLCFAAILLVSGVSKKCNSTLIIMAVVMAELAAILYLLSDLPVETTMGIAASLSAMLLSLSAAMLILSWAGESGAAGFAGIAQLETLITATGGIMVAVGALMEKVPAAEKFLDKGVEVLEKIGYAIGAFFGEMIAGFTGSMYDGLPKMAEDLSKFMDNLQPFLEGSETMDTGSFDNISALSDALSDLKSGTKNFKLPSDLGEQMTMFGEAAKTLSDSLSGNVDVDALEASADAVSAIVMLENVLPNSGSLSDFFGAGDMDEFANGLKNLGAALCSYSESVSGDNEIDKEAIQNSAEAASYLSDLEAGLPSHGGKLQEWLGDSDLGTFGDSLSTFGEALCTYSEAVSGEGAINKKAIKKSAEAASYLSDLEAGLPNHDGKLQQWLGDDTLDSFGDRLKKFGEALVEYSGTVSAEGAINKKAIKNSANAASALSDLESGLPSHDGKLQQWLGDDSLDMFGTRLVSFGFAIARYSNTISKENTIDEDAITSSATAASALAELEAGLPSHDGVLQAWMGDSDLGTFGANIREFAQALVDYSDTVCGRINQPAIEASVNAASQLSSLEGALTDTGGFFSFFTSSNKGLKNFGNRLKKFGGGLSDYADSIKGVDNWGTVAASATYLNDLVKVEAAISQSSLGNMSSFADDLEALGTGIENYYNSIGDVDTDAMTDFTSFAEGLNETINGMISVDADTTRGFESSMTFLAQIGLDAFEDTFSNSTQINDTGIGVAAEFVTGVTSKESDVDQAFQSLADSAVTAVKTKYSSFYSAGRYLVDGFAAGITANTHTARDAASGMASSANSAARSELDIDSPSKVAYETGSYFGQGFVNALYDYEDVSYDAGAGMASSSLAGLNHAIGSISEMIDSDIDTQPTIRPVLDLSDVEAGAGTIGSLFAQSRTLSVNAGSIDAVSASMRKIQNGNDSDELLSAIKGLNRSLSTANRNVYNINGITYDDGSSVANAVGSLVRAVRLERRA